MSVCDSNWWIYTNVATGLLFVLSEILSISSCKCNGVIQLFFTKSACLEDHEAQIELQVRQTVQQHYER